MNSHKIIRQTHRWASIAFTVAVIINLIALATMGQSQSPAAMLIGFAALLPLLLLLPTGLYLFAQPYLARRRGAAPIA